MSISKVNSQNIVRFFMTVLASVLLLVSFSTPAKAYEVEPQRISGLLSSASDVYTTNITVDYARLDTYYLFLVRTGTSGFKTKILDDDGNLLTTLTMESMNDVYPGGTRRTELPNPNKSKGNVTYTIQISTNNFESDCSFNLAVGSFNDAEALISGPSNAIPLARYEEPGMPNSANHGYLRADVIPNQYEQWYKFTASSSTTVSVRSFYEGIRFKIMAISDHTVVYDSNSDTNAHKIDRSIVSPVAYIERVKPGTQLISGKEYYGIWYVGIQSTGRSFSCKPGLKFSYYYEMGD